MSNSSEFSEAASGNRTTTPSPEESAFSKTCNRLREYLKENGSLGDVSLGIALGGDNGFGISPAAAMKSQTLPRSLSSMNLFPLDSPKAGIEDVSKFGDFSQSVAMETKKAQMTIFYGGQVMVFNDMPAGKAMEVMRLASVGGGQVNGTPYSATTGLGVGLMPTASIGDISPPVLGVIPIARKQSLARFLEKRKERIMAHSPYSTNNWTKGSFSASMPADKSWLGLAGS